MGFILTDNGGGDFELIPEATYIATCTLLADIGTHEESYQGQEPRLVEKLYIGWELNAVNSEGKPFTIGTTYNCAFSPKATLRKALEAWRGRAFTEAELAGFDIRNILGKSCGLGIIHKPSAKDPQVKYPRIGSIQALPAGVPAYMPSEAPWIFNLQEFDKALFEKLPALARDVCQRAQEWGLINEEYPPIVDDEPPAF